MSHKNEKRLCHNCDANISIHLSKCPFCGVGVMPPSEETFTGFSSPFQSQEPQEPMPQAPYGQDFVISDKEWKESLEGPEESEMGESDRSEIVAMLLILPGIVFALFGLILLFFSENGVLQLQWNQSFAYFYLLGAAPLLYVGWRAFR